MRKNLLPIIAILVVVISLLIIGGCTKDDTSKIDSTKSTIESLKVIDATPMEAVYTSERLYSCVMHPELVTLTEMDCPLCAGMKMTLVDSTRVASIHLTDMKCCPHCMISLPAISNLSECPICKMPFVAVNRSVEPQNLTTESSAKAGDKG